MRFILEPGRSVPLPAQLLVVRVQARGSSVLPLVEALPQGSGRTAAGGAGRTPGMVALGVSEPTTIRIRPSGGAETFAPHSVFTLTVGAETPEASSVTLPAVDASGLRQRDLVTLVPSGDEVVVTAVVESKDVELPPLAAQARIAAREVLAVPAVPAEEAVALRIVVDTSASMRPLLRSGTVERVLELVMGAAQVIGADRPVQAAGCGQALVGLPPQRLDAFAGEVAAAAAALPASIGFRSRLIPTPGPDEDVVTFVLTDAVPADATGALSGPTPGSGSVPDANPLSGPDQDSSRGRGSGEESSARVHLVLLTAQPASPTYGAPPPGQTRVSPDSPWDTLDQYQVSQLVGSLLSGYRRRRGTA